MGARLCDNIAGTSELGYKGCLSFPHWTWHSFVLLAAVEEQSVKHCVQFILSASELLFGTNVVV